MDIKQVVQLNKHKHDTMKYDVELPCENPKE